MRLHHSRSLVLTYTELKCLALSVLPIQRDVKGASVDTRRRAQLPASRIAGDTCALDCQETGVEDNFSQTGTLRLELNFRLPHENRALEINGDLELGVPRGNILEVAVGVNVGGGMAGTHGAKLMEIRVQRKNGQG